MQRCACGTGTNSQGRWCPARATHRCTHRHTGTRAYAHVHTRTRTVTGLAVSRTGEYVVTGGHDKSIRFWQKSDEQARHTWPATYDVAWGLQHTTYHVAMQPFVGGGRARTSRRGVQHHATRGVTRGGYSTTCPRGTGHAALRGGGARERAGGNVRGGCRQQVRPLPLPPRTRKLSCQ